MIETCPKCNTKRIEDKNTRHLENETHEPCRKCYDWVDNYFESDENK